MSLLVHDHVGLGSQHSGKSLDLGDDVVAEDVDVRSFN